MGEYNEEESDRGLILRCVTLFSWTNCTKFSKNPSGKTVSEPRYETSTSRMWCKSANCHGRNVQYEERI